MMARELSERAGLGACSAEDEMGLVVVKVEEEEATALVEENSVLAPERARLCFRAFRYLEAAGPQEALSRLRELCRQWLRPETHSKEQMLELLVLEQFLAALPGELRARVRTQHPASGEEAAALLEFVEGQLEEAPLQVSRGQGQALLGCKAELVTTTRMSQSGQAQAVKPLLKPASQGPNPSQDTVAQGGSCREDAVAPDGLPPESQVVKCRLRSGACLQLRSVQDKSLGRLRATWMRTLPKFLLVLKLVNGRTGYRESRKMLQGAGGTFAVNVERALLKVQA